MIAENLFSKEIAILGFGIEGESAVGFLLAAGSNITVFDNKQEQEFEKDKLQLFKNKKVSFHFGQFPKDFLGFDLVVRSPGVNPNLPELQQARKDGIKITSPTNIFFELCPCPIIGVTGTKGKGTTSTLIYEMLKASGCNVHLGGNIGTPALDFLSKLTHDSYVVLELSSFQLQDLHPVSSRLDSSRGGPHIAVILMITSEHLDYHKDVYEYVEAKRNILKSQKKEDFAIINRDYPASSESDIHTEGKIFQVSREPGMREQGCFVENGKIVVQLSIRSDLDQGPTFAKKEIIDTKDILLPGRHNLENVCAAVMAATLTGVSKPNIVKVLKSFKGLPHRLELVATVRGVRYYDDSFSTTPETAIAGVEAFEGPEILILGGSSKGSDFTNLAEAIVDPKNNVKAIVGIGKEWERIKSKFQMSNVKFPIYEGLKDMHSIVQKTAEISELGDVVLLSPACASFDMFKDYKDRGEQFKKEVEKLSWKQ